MVTHEPTGSDQAVDRLRPGRRGRVGKLFQLALIRIVNGDTKDAYNSASDVPVVVSNTYRGASNKAALAASNMPPTAAANKKQRWSRSGYNAYMREYMRRRR